MKIEKLNDNCWKIILEEKQGESEKYIIDLAYIAYDLYNQINFENVKLIGYFASKIIINNLAKFKDACGHYLISQDYLFYADLPDNEIIVKFEPIKIYLLKEILK
jgi:hypothetical protein